MTLEPDNKPERLLSLLIVLLSTRRGLLKEEIFRAVRGYSDALNKSTTIDAIDKKFDRDKDSLAELGIQVEKVALPGEEHDNTRVRYRISSAEFMWPKNTYLTENQLRLLELAAKVWARASLSSETNRALSRLKALGVTGEDVDLAGFVPRVLTAEPSFLALEEAKRECLEVSFHYRTPDGEISQRRVRPWQLRNVHGQWLLVCWDVERNDVRNFLLKRIVSRIERLNIPFEPVTSEQMQQADEALDQFVADNVATIRVEPNTEAWVHFGLDAPGSSEDGQLSFNYMDMSLLADELRQYGRAITVIAPEKLKQAIRAGLEKVVNEHA